MTRAVVLLLATAALVSLGARDALAACTGGDTSIAGACANAWERPPSGSVQPFYPWDDNTWQSSSAQSALHRLNPANCPSVRIRSQTPSRGFLEVSCGNSSGRFLINEDALACSANNIAEHPNLLHRNDANACTSFGVYHATDPDNLLALERTIDSMNQQVPRRVLSRALEKFKRNRTLVTHDMMVLSDIYDQEYQRLASEGGGENPDSEAAHTLGLRFKRALQSLERKVATATGVFGSLDEDGNRLRNCTGTINRVARIRLGGDTEAVQARRTCKLLVRTYEHFKEIWDESQATTAERLEESGLPIGPTEREHYMTTAAGRRLIDRVLKNVACEDRVANNDDMAMRMFLYSGLSEAEQRDISPTGPVAESALPQGGKLALFRWANEFRGYGQGAFGEITNGYVYGGHRERFRFIGIGRRQAGSQDSSNDCSTFVSGLFMPGSAGVDSPTTLDFENMGRILRGEHLSEAELRNAARFTRLRSCLEVVDYRTTAPQPSDILVSRTAGDAHIVVVHSYNRDTGRVRTLEAAGSASSNNTIDFTMERTIYEPSCLGANRPAESDWQVRPVRAGLTALRFKANPPASCPLRQQ